MAEPRRARPEPRNPRWQGPPRRAIPRRPAILVATLVAVVVVGAAWLLRDPPSPLHGVTDGAALSATARDGPANAASALPPTAAEPPPPRSIASDDPDDVDSDDGEAVRAATAAAAQAAGESFTRADVLAGMAQVEDRIADCYGPEGRGTVKLTIAGSGRVLSATVAGPLAGTRASECVEAAAREAIFRSTRREVTTLLWTLPIHAGAP